LAATPLRIEGEGFLLTCCGQSAINIFTASAFNGNFVFVLVEHRRHKKQRSCAAGNDFQLGPMAE
jgi:hypothetical protein